MTAIEHTGPDFGANSWLVDEMYARYLADPELVGESWRDFFSDYRPAPVTFGGPAANGQVGNSPAVADGNGATIVRTSEGNKQYSVRLKDLVRRGDVAANVEVRPGDILIIPQSFF